MKLIVGLGNPGRRYAMSRHNIGFLVLDKLAKSLGQRAGGFKKETRFSAELLTLRPTPYTLHPLLLAKPQTFMNAAGRAVRAIASFHRIKPHDILVVSDDIDMEFGKIRFRREGSSGGHKGLESIISALGTDKFSRLKIGVGRDPKIAPDKYVLGKFAAEQKKKLPRILEEAAQEAIKHLASSRASALAPKR